MKKRTRKKLHIEEFTEYGFEVKMELNMGEHKKEEMKFLDDVINFVELHKMYMGGAINNFYVCKECGTATEEDRAMFLEWAQNDDRINSVKIKPLTNAWYGGIKPATRYNFRILRKKMWEE